MTPDNHDADLTEGLAIAAAAMIESGAFTPERVAEAFGITGACLAVHHGGIGAAADWLRNLADMAERGELGGGNV